MKKNSELKNVALAALKGNWAPALVASIVITFTISILMSPGYCANMALYGMWPFTAIKSSLVTVLSNVGLVTNIFLLYPLMFGYSVAHKELMVSGDTNLTANSFRYAFTGYLKNVLAMFLVYVLTILWSLLLVVPGIIKGLSYSLTPYIIKDYPELSANQAIDLSVRMMNGHKAKLFWLWLSFIGWFILSILTLGVGLLWLLPYMQTTLAAFYLDVKADFN